jgi:hypothetical protein
MVLSLGNGGRGPWLISAACGAPCSIPRVEQPVAMVDGGLGVAGAYNNIYVLNIVRIYMRACVAGSRSYFKRGSAQPGCILGSAVPEYRHTIF